MTRRDRFAVRVGHHELVLEEASPSVSRFQASTPSSGWKKPADVVELALLADVAPCGTRTR